MYMRRVVRPRIGRFSLQNVGLCRDEPGVTHFTRAHRNEYATRYDFRALCLSVSEVSEFLLNFY